MAIKYKRHARGGRFKAPNAGDLGISALRERNQTIIDSLQLQRNQQAEIDRDQMTAMERSFDKEAQNVKDLQQLEDKIYANKRDAIKIRNQRDIEAIKGRADEYGRAAQHWESLSPKLAKAFGELAKGYGDVRETMGYLDYVNDPEAEKTLDIWSKEFDKGIQLAHEQNQNDQDELEGAGATETQLQALDGTSGMYKIGMIDGLASDLIDNIDMHIATGKMKWIEMNGNPQSVEEYKKMGKWIQATIEKRTGIQGYKYSRGVLKFRKQFDKSFAANTKKWTDARVQKIFAVKFQEVNQTLEAGLKLDNKDYYGEVNTSKFHNIIWLVERRGYDKDGKKIATNTKDAINYIFNHWAEDLTISTEELKRRLDFATPKDGRQKPNETIGSRHPRLWEQILEKRRAAENKKVNQFNTSEKLLQAKGKSEVMIMHGEGAFKTPADYNNKIKELNDAGMTDAAKWLQTKSMAKYDNTHEVRTSIERMINNQEWAGAWSYIQHQGDVGLPDEDRKKYLGSIQPLRDWSAAGFNLEGGKDNISDALSGSLEKALGYKGDDARAGLSLQQKLIEAKTDLLTTYQGYLGQYKNTKDTNQRVRLALTSALKEVQGKIDRKEGIYTVLKASQRKGTNAPIFASSEKFNIDQNDLTDWPPFKIQELARAGKLHTLLDGKSKVVSNNQLATWVATINSGGTPESYNLIDDIAKSLHPRWDHRYNKPSLVIKTIMKNSGNPEAVEASKLITLDNNDLVSMWTEDKPNLNLYITKTVSNVDKINFLSVYEHINELGYTPFDPERLNNTVPFFTGGY